MSLIPLSVEGFHAVLQFLHLLLPEQNSYIQAPKTDTETERDGTINVTKIPSEVNSCQR